MHGAESYNSYSIDRDITTRRSVHRTRHPTNPPTQVRHEGQDHRDSEERREAARGGSVLQPRGRGESAGLRRALHGT